MTLVPAVQGIVATVIAVAIVLSWIAIGSVFFRSSPDDELTVPVAILIGSGLTSFVLAVFVASGLVWTGTVTVFGAALAMLVARRKATIRLVAYAFGAFARQRLDLRIAPAGIALGLVLWASAVSPPRSADAMRYHLAHIRQIISDGRWVPISDFHYALPFGWTLSFLPFEMLGLPQGSQVLGLLLLLVIVAAIARSMSNVGVSKPAVLAGLALLLHPAALRLFIEANADGYALLVILVIAMILIRLPALASRETLILGFASVIGMQSRYQLAAAGLAAALTAYAFTRRSPARLAAAIAWFGGAASAAALAAPFYLANWTKFASPVWPLMIRLSPRSSYADSVAYQYGLSLGGLHNAATFMYGVRRLLTESYMFPLAILIVAVAIVAATMRRESIRPLGVFAILFLGVWAVMQPMLYPRFILMLLPVCAICTTMFVEEISARAPKLRRPITIVVGIFVAGLTVTAGYINRDSLQFLMTGDARVFHRYTWFYPTYEWIGKNTPRDARFLVIVTSGHTYYLDRAYRRADPWISPTVDWTRVDTGPKLDSLLARENFRYVLYENRDWSWAIGGPQMQRAVAESFKAGHLRDVASFEDTLFSSRLHRRYRTTRVQLFERSTQP